METEELIHLASKFCGTTKAENWQPVSAPYSDAFAMETMLAQKFNLEVNIDKDGVTVVAKPQHGDKQDNTLAFERFINHNDDVLLTRAYAALSVAAQFGSRMEFHHA